MDGLKSHAEATFSAEKIGNFFVCVVPTFNLEKGNAQIVNEG